MAKRFTSSQRYSNHLSEPRVRAQHDPVIALIATAPVFQRVIDLGCSRGAEFRVHGKPEEYVGIDRDAVANDEPGRHILAGNYRDVAGIRQIAIDHDITALVSLFSSETSAPRAVNDAYYANLFKETGVAAILTSGFYTLGDKNQETVRTGGIFSYQTPFHQADGPRNRIFTETRIARPCPSALFGADVVEVYRLLTNNAWPAPLNSSFVTRFKALGFAEAALERALAPKRIIMAVPRSGRALKTLFMQN